MAVAISYTLSIDGTPASPELLAAIQQVEVEDHASLADMLRLRLSVAVTANGAAWKVIDDDLFPRLANVQVRVTVGSGPAEPLINAYVLETAAEFSSQPGESTLNVVAMDPTLLMNLDEKVKAWPNMTDSDIATAIFGDYNFTPVVESTSIQRSETNQTPIQRGTDIQFLQRLARRNGYECYVETNAQTGNVEGHFHPPQLQQTPQGVLTVGMGQAGNVTSLKVRHDMLRPVTVQANGLDVSSGEAQSGQADSASLRTIGSQAALSGDRPRRVLLSGTGLVETSELQAYAQAVVDQSSWAIWAEGEVNTVVYGSVLHAKRLVAVRGAGRRLSGDYYVEKVLHVLNAQGYVQRFTLRRNALGLTGQESFVEDRALPVQGGS